MKKKKIKTNLYAAFRRALLLERVFQNLLINYEMAKRKTSDSSSSSSSSDARKRKKKSSKKKEKKRSKKEKKRGVDARTAESGGGGGGGAPGAGAELAAGGSGYGVLEDDETLQKRALDAKHEQVARKVAQTLGYDDEKNPFGDP